MSVRSAGRIALATDASGIGTLLWHVPRECIVCVIAASRWPQYLPAMRETAYALGARLLVQPPRQDPAFAEFLRELRSLQLDLLLCNSYSMIFPRDVLDSVAGNAVNVHAALLPKNRGPNPVQWCLIKGEVRTGVTLHFMGDGADDGDIVGQRAIDVFEDDTWVTLGERCDAETETLLRDFLPSVLAGRAVRIPQDCTAATLNPRLTPNSPRIDWANMSDRDVFNLIRAQVAPLAGAYCMAKDGTRAVFDQYVAMRDIPKLRERHAG